MKNRRNFLKGTLFGALGALLAPKIISNINTPKENINSKEGFPMVISTWNHGLEANQGAMNVLNQGGNSLDVLKLELESQKQTPKTPVSDMVAFPIEMAMLL